MAAQKGVQWHRFDSRQQLADDLAMSLQGHLQSALRSAPTAILALSGGTTPRRMMGALARLPLPWQSIVITLVDERMVAPDDSRANARLVREALLDALPADTPPRFAPLHLQGETLDAAASRLGRQLGHWPPRFAAMVLGMGLDGHIASMFPDADNINELLDAGNPDPLAHCRSATAQVARITWTMPVLLASGFVALHLEGADKLEVLQKAMPPERAAPPPLPVGRLLHHAQRRRPLSIYHAP